MRGQGSIPTGGNILSLDFFYIVKPLMPILALLPILFICEKPEWLPFFRTEFQSLPTFHHTYDQCPHCWDSSSTHTRCYHEQARRAAPIDTALPCCC